VVPSSESDVARCSDGRLGTTLMTPPGSMMPYSSEAGPLSSSTLSAVAFRPRPCTRGMPSTITDPSRLLPKPRFMTASIVPASVLPCEMPLRLFKASSRLRGR